MEVIENIVIIGIVIVGDGDEPGIDASMIMIITNIITIIIIVIIVVVTIATIILIVVIIIINILNLVGYMQVTKNRKVLFDGIGL